jgi:hypothetical protein
MPCQEKNTLGKVPSNYTKQIGACFYNHVKHSEKWVRAIPKMQGQTQLPITLS